MNSKKTNTCSLLREEKIADGIYITKANHKMTIEGKKEESKEKPKYFFKSTAELINILETEFEEIGNQIEMLYDANEQMLEYDPDDYDLIEARQENLEIINKKLLRLKDIQNELKVHCPTNPIVLKDVFEYFLNRNKDENKEKIKEDEEEMQMTSNVSREPNSNTDNNTQVTMEIDL